MKKYALLLISILIILTLIGCAPAENETTDIDQNALVATAVKQTDDARVLLTEQAAPTATVEVPTDVPEPTETSEPTEPAATPLPTVIPPTATSTTPCLSMLFIEDITIQDNDWITPGDPFTKTWSIRNTGSCDWTSGYKIEFDYGAQMNSPASFSLPETVYPGHDVDVTVELVAPMDAGSYIGNFKIKSDTGIYFGTFYVQIIVPIPELADFDGNTLEVSYSDFGSVDAAGNVSTTYAYAGDTVDDDRIQAFFEFGLTDIPVSATIDAAYLLIPSYSVSGDPFEQLGCLRVYSGAFFALGAGDYGTGGEYEYIQYCSAADLASAKISSALYSQIESSLAAGKIELQLFFYLTQSDDDIVADYVSIGDIRLLIYYTP